ncbi:MAG TPA: sugar phosphate nucleotidyltransferase, partial [Inquilinus sp.]|nr:sugar phosphate nucleotidyltransferase [Inquilinus sp.]
MPQFQRLLGDGSQWGMAFDYAVQPSPDGLAQAYVIGADFVAGGPSALILGDNIYHGHGLPELLHAAVAEPAGATVFAYYVNDPERYGVVTFGADGRAAAIEEKPRQPASNWAVTGLYFYDAEVVEIAANLQPSARGELEITDVNRAYLERGALHVQKMGRGFAWFDMGTHDSLLEASGYVQTLERRQGLSVACPEEIAYAKGFINRDELITQAKRFEKSGYGRYLLRVAEG